MLTLLIIFVAAFLAYGYFLNRHYEKKVGEKVKLIKDVESQLVQMEKMASVGVLAAGIAHEINNPLGFLISNLESLNGYTHSLNAQDIPANKNSPFLIDDLRAMTEESLEGARRIKRIVSDLRTFSRQSESSRTLVDINQVLESTLAIVWNEIKYKLSVSKDFQAKTNILADPTQLSQVFLNLFINASQACAEKGSLSLSTYEDADMLYIKVSDTGCGIPKEALSRIFEPFFSTKKSSGLGLSVSYNIIRHHGGDIRAESSPGKGTTFTISLPKKGEGEGKND